VGMMAWHSWIFDGQKLVVEMASAPCTSHDLGHKCHMQYLPIMPTTLTIVEDMKGCFVVDYGVFAP